MKKLLVVLLVTPLAALAQINAQCPQFTVNGTPQYAAQPGDQELCKSNYAIIHRCGVKAPIAVFERLTVAAMTSVQIHKCSHIAKQQPIQVMLNAGILITVS